MHTLNVLISFWYCQLFPKITNIIKSFSFSLATTVQAYFPLSLGIEKSFWVGATDYLDEGNFIWSDGSPVQMGAPFWASVSRTDFWKTKMKFNIFNGKMS